MIGVVVDSNSQMPPALAERYGIEVVPLTVTIDGVDHREGVDLDVDEFYRSWSDGRVPEISTSQPSPGQFAKVYRSLVDAGADEIISIHITESMSGTLNSARLAAAEIDVPVHLVDSGTASFGISCCAWAAALALEAGENAHTAVRIAESRAAALHTSFVVGVPSLVDRSGRADGVDLEIASGDGIPVLAMTGSDLSVLTTANGLADAVQAMVDDALQRPPSDDGGLRIAVGTSDASSEPMSTAITELLIGDERVAEILHYRIGPSVGAHTGPGTAGLFVF